MNDNAAEADESSVSNSEASQHTSAVRLMNALMKIVVENIDEMVIVTTSDLDRPGPHIEYVNPCFTRVTGYEAHEVVGESPRILQGPSTDRAMLEKMSAALSQGCPFSGEAVNYRKDGTQYYVEWLITPTHGPDGRIKHWVSVQRDITKHKQLQIALAAQDERLRSILQSTLDYAIFVTDPQDRIVDWWPGAAAVYGWRPEQVIGQQASITFTAEDRDVGVPEDENAVAERDGSALNVRWHLHADGHQIFIDGSVRALRGPDGSLMGFLKVGQDVTARKAAEKQLRDSEARLARAVAAARMSTWEWDAPSGSFHFSAGMSALFNRPEGSLSSVASVIEAIHPEDRPAAALIIERVLKGKVEGDLAVEFRVPLPGGQTRWLLVTGQAEPNDGYTPPRLAGVTQDITERREAEKHIVYMARHDALTGLPNRTTLEELLTNALQRSRRGEACAVLALDLDDFKEVNDALGHAAGDALLCSVAARLRESMREVDVVARPGGDEFLIIQSDLHQAREAEVLAARLIAELERPHEIDGHVVSIGVSIGIAMVPVDGTDMEQVLKVADLALYAAKKQGGHCYRFFEPEMQALAESRRQMASDLRQAITRGEFELHYQPFVELPQNRIVGFEALVRWRHPLRGLVMPNEFIPLAEETGLIEPLGTWVLNTACAEASRWPAPLRIAVNLSVRQLSAGNLLKVVATALAEGGLEPNRLELEITETMLLSDTEENLAKLHQLRTHGVSISVDDFGTGYSSLSYFSKFPFDRMKIDRSFIAQGQERHGAAIIRSVIDLCDCLDIAVTAEGVETVEQLSLVSSLGCKECQGFLFAMPCLAADIAQLIIHWNGAVSIP